MKSGEETRELLAGETGVVNLNFLDIYIANIAGRGDAVLGQDPDGLDGSTRSTR